MMRRLQFGLVLVVLCFAVPAWSSVVIPGASTGAGDTFTYVDGFIDAGTCSVPGGCAALEARLLSAVYANDASGNLLFLWQVINDSAPNTLGIGVDTVQTWRFFSPELVALSLTTGTTNDAALFADLDVPLNPFPVPGALPTVSWNAPIVQASFGVQLNSGQNSGFWFAYTTAQAYHRTDHPFPDCGFGPSNLCTAQAFGVDNQFLTVGRNFDTFEPAAVPEPASLFLMGSGLVGLAGALRRKLAR